jgi:hypothetical protein
MGLIGSFFRLVISLAIFVAVIVLGAIFAPQMAQAFNGIPGGTITVGSVQIPLVASIVASVVLTIVVNLIALPFRNRSESV